MSKFLNVSIDAKQGIREAVEQIAAEPGTKVFYLDGKKINSKETFLSKAAEAMQFPTYFGANWDAFDECIAVAKAVRTVCGKRAFKSVLCDFIAVLSSLSVAISPI
ncbi:barstar family protein [Nostoc sp.]|uniref:barstar family protein n=1 Tax=Nostoc sp. TaxID=1180 RepID=UPI002FFD3F2D